MRKSVYELAKFTLLPGVVPRTRKLFFSGFDHLSFFVAQAYAALRLLPSNHPYLNSANYGRYGIRNVMGEARRHLIRDRYHADQVILYYTLMIGFVIVVMQFGLMMGSIAIKKASAACFAVGGPGGGTPPMPTTITFPNPLDCFVTGSNLPGNPKTDLAYNMLDLIFGLNTAPAVYGSNSLAGAPNAFQTALQNLFEFYNVGILAVAVIVFLYMFVTMIGETTESGSPFGRRFNGAWAPLRMIWAVAILCPLTYGLNGGQLATLYIAKWGSSMATNGWLLFSQVVTYGGTGTQMPPVPGSFAEINVGTGGSMVAYPQSRVLSGVLEYMFVVMSCANYEKLMHGRDVGGYIVYNDPVSGTTKNWLLLPNGGGAITMPFATAIDVNHTNNHDIRIRFGEGPAAAPPPVGAGPPPPPPSATANFSYDQFEGDVSPICGEMTFEITAVPQATGGPVCTDWYCPTSPAPAPATSTAGALDMERDYFVMLGNLWSDTATLGAYGNQASTLQATSLNFVKQRLPNDQRDPNATTPAPVAGNSSWTDYINYYFGTNGYLTTYESYAIYYAWVDQITKGSFAENFGNLGWAGAAIWYNKIAEMNGSFISAVHAIPMADKYPEVMETVSAQKQATDHLIDPMDRYKPYKADGQLVDFANPDDKYEALMLYQAQQLWRQGYQAPTNSTFIDTIISIFGLEDLYSMRQNIVLGISPLAHLVAIGRSLIEASIRNLGFSFGAGLAGGIANVLGLVPLHTVGMAASKIVAQAAFLGIGIGFVLFYVIPFLPFLYFFFSMGTWIKSIFQALVGIPLWGIAHMRIDGEGLPGRAAMNGYYLLLEVFIRPILCVVGLIAGLTAFAAELGVLNDAWDTLIANVTGFDYSNTVPINPKGVSVAAGGVLGTLRGTVDQFFYTVLYAIISYIMALNSFKLCDKFPDHFMQWIGSDLESFGEKDPNPAEGLLKHIAYAEQMLGDSKNSLMLGLAERNSD